MMRKFIFTSSLAAVVLMITGFSTEYVHEPDADYDYLSERLMNIKNHTIDLLRAMPDSIYNFKPNEDLRSFQELAYHMVYSIEWNLEQMKGNPVKWVSGGEDQMTKKELINFGDKQFDKLVEFIKAAKETPTLTDKLIDVLNHNAHHQGQMVTYLRLKGIAPPN